MPIDTTVWASDLGAMIEDLPAYAKWDGREFAVSITELTREETLVLTGNISGVTMACIFPFTAITGLPEPTAQDRIEIKRPGEMTYSRYMIITALKPADAVAWNLTLNDDTRN